MEDDELRHGDDSDETEESAVSEEAASEVNASQAFSGHNIDGSVEEVLEGINDIDLDNGDEALDG